MKYVHLNRNSSQKTLLAILTISIFLLLPFRSYSSHPTPRRPNIIFFLTDDQDVTAGSLNYMPHLNDLFRREGLEFQNYYVPTGLCCPSRATILRGQYCHNHKIYDNGDLNNATYKSGAVKKFINTNMEQETVATILQSEGYETALFGKYMNGYEDYIASHVPPGWDHWVGMTKTNYYGPHFSKDGNLEKTSNDTYQTDYLRDVTYKFLTSEEKTKRNTSKPFFLYIAPFAPHAPALPAKRHEHLFQDLKAPRFESFNPSDDIQQMKPSWIKRMPPLTDEQISDIDIFYRKRIRSLQAVDEFLLNLTQTLESIGVDDNTWVFYMGDNGQHLGDFRIPPGKRQAYETDVLVPFLVRGPGITTPGKNVTEVVQSVDLLPTWLDLARSPIISSGSDGNSNKKGNPHNIIPSYAVDGKSFLPLLNGVFNVQPKTNQFRSVALLEMFGGSSGVGRRYKDMPGYHRSHFYNNTYQAIRVINGTGWAMNANWLYVEWCTGGIEFYNVSIDPHQINNLAYNQSWLSSKEAAEEGEGRTNLTNLIHLLSDVLGKIGNCSGKACYEIHFDEEKMVTSSGTTQQQNLLLSFKTLQDKIRHRLPCFNPVTTDNDIVALYRKPFAVNLFVPAPFEFGFPFADADQVPEEQMEIWEQYKHYFY